eukprot:m.72979 g.72979  ORF g.72979 m.72979 type:complete len:661 (+) comp14299_c0_seq1:201-2183(+)
MEAPEDPTSADQLLTILKFFAKDEKCNGGAPERKHVASVVKRLFERDYDVQVVANTNGRLCDHYPAEILVLESHKDSEHLANNVDELRSLFSSDSRFARCRMRFVVPVILVGNMNICRSATLSRAPEILYRQSYTSAVTAIYGDSSAESLSSSQIGGKATNVEDSVYLATAAVDEVDGPNPLSNGTKKPKDSGSTVAKCRAADLALLKHLGVNFICDLMIEHRKFKYGLYVTSSEKADTEDRYKEFGIAAMPYPGVEWFNSMREQQYNPRKIFFNWQHREVSVALGLPASCSNLSVSWKYYKTWDLVSLTQNYLRVLINHISGQGDTGSDGLLVHCVSGWDRTPLFISLLRLSLWADGVIHQSLSAQEMLYLTVGYDWLLFGHMLPTRLNKGEEIFLFCFDFLQFITGDEFAFKSQTPASPSNLSEEEAMLKTPVVDARSPPIPVATGAGEVENSDVDVASLLTQDESAWEDVPSLASGDHVLLSDSDGGADSSGSRRDSVDTPHAASAPIAVPALTVDKPPSESPAASVDSWQLVEESSSLRSTLAQALLESGGSNGSKPTPPPLNLDLPSLDDGDNSDKSYPCTCHVEGLPCRAPSHTPPTDVSLRAKRLHQVRALFIPLYRQAVPTTGSHDGWMSWVTSTLMPSSWAGTGGAPPKRS